LTTNGNSARGLWTFNATDGSATAVVNNYRGRHLNSPNDVVIDSNSNLWFTDPAYGWYSAWPGVSAPELPNSIYFFNTTSKALISLSNSVALVPNGLALSEDESILYVTDSNSTSGQPTQNYAASQRNVWAFDIDGVMLSNPRLVYEVESGWPDGLRVTRNGLLIIAVLGGADVIDPHTGILLGRINAVDDIIFNVESVPGTGTWFMTGQNFIYKFTIKEKSLVFK
jgi:sugar lactone lactonase YvrE